MSEFLLVVPKELAKERFENWSVATHSNLLTMIPDVLSATHSAASFLALTCSTDANSVRQMLKALKNMRDTDRRIVFADDAIPNDVRTAVPKSLIGFLQRVLPCDLMCVSASIVPHMVADTMLMTLFGGELEMEAVTEPQRLERFPAAGPGNNIAGVEISATTLASAVDAALSSVKVSSSEAKCITAGILLLWDFLDESHEISQTLESRGTPRTGDYWHGIMHRREPDAGNASYWFRRVGPHPAFDSLAKNLDRWLAETGASEDERSLALRILVANGSFNPFAAIELSTKALREPGQLEDRTLRRVQYLEILNLLLWSLGGIQSPNVIKAQT